MPWLKTSDQAADHPIVIAPLESEEADDRIVNELFGWVARCAVRAAAYETDYVIDMATARHVAGGVERFKVLRDAALSSGYMVRAQITGPDGGQRDALRLVEEDDLFHMLRKDERKWETQRRRDTNNRDITGPVRMRDGDGCRYCQRIVQWRDRRSSRSATLDHVHGSEHPVKSSADLVVACRACNSRKKEASAESAGMTLQPAPSKPFYGPATVAFLKEEGFDVEPSTDDPGSRAAASEGSSDAQGDPAGQQARSEGPHVENPGSPQAAPEGRSQTSGTDDPGSSRESNRELGREAEGPRYTGSGRDGSGRDMGRAGSRAGPGLGRGQGQVGGLRSSGGKKSKRRRKR